MSFNVKQYLSMNDLEVILFKLIYFQTCIKEKISRGRPQCVCQHLTNDFSFTFQNNLVKWILSVNIMEWSVYKVLKFLTRFVTESKYLIARRFMRQGPHRSCPLLFALVYISFCVTLSKHLLNEKVTKTISTPFHLYTMQWVIFSIK